MDSSTISTAPTAHSSDVLKTRQANDHKTEPPTSGAGSQCPEVERGGLHSQDPEDHGRMYTGCWKAGGMRMAAKATLPESGLQARGGRPRGSHRELHTSAKEPWSPCHAGAAAAPLGPAGRTRAVLIKAHCGRETEREQNTYQTGSGARLERPVVLKRQASPKLPERASRFRFRRQTPSAKLVSRRGK